MTRIVLASRSPARARLLAEAGVEVELRPTDVDETGLKATLLAEGASPRRVAEALAEAKAAAVSGADDALVIGADQTLDLDGELFDKPASMDAARAQLLRLQGRSHRLHAAACVRQHGIIRWRSVQSPSLRVRNISAAFLDGYLAREGEAVLGCVGAYRLEALGAQLFEGVEGDYFAVLGLPLLPLLAFLRAAGALPW